MFLKSLAKVLGAAALAAAVAAPAQAQQFFRIGTGGTAGTYYPVGGMIANLVTQPGKLFCGRQQWIGRKRQRHCGRLA